MGIDDKSSHPRLCSEVADGVTCLMGVRLFREPDAVTPPVRFDEREQETEPGQTGLRRAKRKPSPTATGRLKSLRLFSTLPELRLLEFEGGRANLTFRKWHQSGIWNVERGDPASAGPGHHILASRSQDAVKDGS